MADDLIALDQRTADELLEILAQWKAGRFTQIDPQRRQAPAGRVWSYLAKSTGTITAAGTTTITCTGSTTSGGFTIQSLSATNDLFVGMTVAGAGIPAGASIVSVDSSSQVTLDAPATASASVSLTFSGLLFGSGTVEIYGLVEGSDGSYRPVDQFYAETAYQAGLAAVPSGAWLILVLDPYSGRLLIAAVVGGQSAYLAVTTSDITARVGDQLGTGTAELRSIPGGLLTDTEVQVDVCNKFAHIIPTGVVVSLLRDSTSGLLWVVEPDAQHDVACIASSLNRLLSVDGGNSWNFTDLCIPCGCSGSGGGCLCGLSYCVSVPAGYTCGGTSGTTYNAVLSLNTLDCKYYGSYIGPGSLSYNVNLSCSGGVWTLITPSVTGTSGTDTETWQGAYACNYCDAITVTSTTCPSASLVVTPGSICGSGSGSGSGGSCNITRTQLLATSQTGTSFSATVPGTVPAGALLVVKVGITPSGGSASATYGGNAMADDLNAVNAGGTGGIWYSTFSYKVLAPTTGATLVVNNSGTNSLFLVIAVQEVGLTSNAADFPASSTNTGTGSPDSGFGADTATACEIAEAGFVVYGASGTPTWRNGFSAGALVADTFGGQSFGLIDGYRILTSITAVDAMVTTFTAIDWAGGEVPYK